jgi:FMN-dependent NADH-azoreductase
MTKTLAVSYAPGAPHSYTRRLVEAFIDIVQGKYTQLEHLNLLSSPPSLISPAIYDAYYRRNIGHEELSVADQEPIAYSDELALQFKNADVVVLAFPVYAFSLPAAMKAYLEAVTQQEVTFEVTSRGYQGLMTGKKALVLSTSGGDVFSTVSNGSTLAAEQVRQLCAFMNFAEYEVIAVDGLQSSPERCETLFAQAVGKVSKLADTWYQV